MDVNVYLTDGGAAIARTIRDEYDPGMFPHKLIVATDIHAVDDDYEDEDDDDWDGLFEPVRNEDRYGDNRFQDLPRREGMGRNCQYSLQECVTRQLIEETNERPSRTVVTRMMRRHSGQQPREHFSSRITIRCGMRHDAEDFAPFVECYGEDSTCPCADCVELSHALVEREYEEDLRLYETYGYNRYEQSDMYDWGEQLGEPEVTAHGWFTPLSEEASNERFRAMLRWRPCELNEPPTTSLDDEDSLFI